MGARNEPPRRIATGWELRARWCFLQLSPVAILAQCIGKNMVVKSFFVKGKTAADGSIVWSIDERDAKIAFGQWRVCLSNLVLKLTSNENGAPVSVSTNLAFQHTEAQSLLAPAFKNQDRPVRISVFSVSGWKDEVIGTITEGTTWVHFENPPNTVKLYFTDEAKAVPFVTELYATILLERTS